MLRRGKLGLKDEGTNFKGPFYIVQWEIISPEKKQEK
jgi:hypothetical protein